MSFAFSKSRAWSPAEDRDALAMKSSGESHRKIGLALNRSTQAVDNRLAVLLDRAQRGPSVTRNRPCITCLRPFRSSGPGNRMCSRCRQLSFSPYAL